MWNAPPLLPVVCGKCGRVLRRLNGVVRTDGSTGGGRVWVTGAKPSVVAPAAAGGSGRYTYRCHRRCGAHYVVKGQRLEAAVAEALEKRRPRVTLGVDLYMVA